MDGKSRREIEKKVLAASITWPWSVDNLDWLSRAGMYKGKVYLQAVFDLQSYFFQSLDEPTHEGTVISLDILQEQLKRLALLKELLQDKTLAERSDVKTIMPNWRFTYDTIYQVIGNNFLAADYSLNMIIDSGIRINTLLAEHEINNPDTRSIRRKIEESLLTKGRLLAWTRKDLRWLAKAEEPKFLPYLQALISLSDYYFGQVEVPNGSEETTVISLDVIGDLWPRLDLLKTLRQDQKLNDRAYIKAMMKKWHPAFQSIYEVIDAKLVPLEGAFNSILENGCKRINYLSKH